MTTRISTPIKHKRRQQGLASILVILTLVAGMATLALTTSRSSLLEQLISNNGFRGKEAHKASEAALEFVIAWTKNNPVPPSAIPITCGTTVGCPVLPPMSGNDTGAFTLSVIFTRDIVDPNYIKVEAIAEQPDNKSKATTSCFIKIAGTTAPYTVTIIPGTWKDF